MAKEAAGGDLGRVGDAKPVLQASALPADYALAADGEFAGGEEHRTAIFARREFHLSAGIMSVV
jgi:hypothetical protein